MNAMYGSKPFFTAGSDASVGWDDRRIKFESLSTKANDKTVVKT